MSKVRFESQSVFVGWAGLIQLKGENVSQAPHENWMVSQSASMRMLISTPCYSANKLA